MKLHLNEQGEVDGFGPPWACDGYGSHGHDYLTCQDCWDRYELYLRYYAPFVPRDEACA
jgi:hypothetical protein